MTAVGNRPYSGRNPPKYLDAFIDTVSYRDAEGNLREITKNSTLSGDFGKEKKLYIHLTNLGEAALLSEPDTAGKPGAVYLTLKGNRMQEIPMPNRLNRFESADIVIPLSEKDTGRMTLGFTAKGRGDFGPRFIFTLPEK